MKTVNYETMTINELNNEIIRMNDLRQRTVDDFIGNDIDNLDKLANIILDIDDVIEKLESELRCKTREAKGL